MLITTDITNLRFRLLNFRAFANFFANLRPHANLMQILPLFLNFLAPFLTFYYIRTKMKFTSCGTEFANLRICLFNFRTFVKNSQTCEVLYEVKKRKKNNFFFVFANLRSGVGFFANLRSFIWSKKKEKKWIFFFRSSAKIWLLCSASHKMLLCGLYRFRCWNSLHSEFQEFYFSRKCSA